MPYVIGGHNDKLFPWKGSHHQTNCACISHPPPNPKEAKERKEDPKLKHAYS